MPIEIVMQAAAKVGGVSNLAQAIGIKHPSLYRWRRVPATRVLAIERVSGISRHVIRPDIYPIEPKK